MAHEAYLLKFDEINRFDFSRKSRDDIEDDFIELLAEAYFLGIEELSSELRKKVESELDEMEDIMWAEIAGETFIDRMDKHLANGDYGLLKNLAESEFHRVYNAAMFSGAKRSGAVSKTWNSMRDWRVRDTHWILDGTTIPIDDYFLSMSGDAALEPGGFETADENANCRCYLTYR